MSKRFSLREFQQNILDRIEQEEASTVRHAATLGVQLKDSLWLVEMQDISEVLPPPAVTPVPLTRPWYRGVANVRGNLYSISDLAYFMGLGETQGDSQTRVLLSNPKLDCNAGILVSRVLGLRDTTGWRREQIEGDEQFHDDQGQVWRKLNLAQLFQQPDFLHVGV